MGIFVPEDQTEVYVSAAEDDDYFRWHQTLSEAVMYVNGNGDIYKMTFSAFKNLIDSSVDPDAQPLIEDYQPVWECWK